MRYQDSQAFRQALEDRLYKESTETGQPLAYLRKRVAFQRFAARLFSPDPDPSASSFVLKGAFALVQYVLVRRVTKDLDLAFRGEESTLRDALQEAAGRDLGDFFRFKVYASETERSPQEPGAHRFSVEAILAGRTFERFPVDVVMEPLGPESVQELTLPSSLEFAGIEPPTVRAVALPRHYADKVHAYTRPRECRSRVKDLVDLALLTLELEDDPEAPARIRAEMEAVFSLHGTHEIPDQLEKPPKGWASPFKEEAGLSGLEPPEIDVWFDRVAAFYRMLSNDAC